MTAAFKFHPRKGTLPFNNETDLFDTTELGLVEVHDLNVPSSVFGIECIHPEEITSKMQYFHNLDPETLAYINSLWNQLKIS